MAKTVHLNSLPYVIDGEITEEHLDPFATAIRLEGNQRLGGVQARNSLILPAPTNGMGLTKIPAREIDNPRLLRRSADSTLDTRCTATTLPRALTAATAAMGGSASLKGPLFTTQFAGKLLGQFEASKSGVQFVLIREWDGATSTWTVPKRGTTADGQHSGTVRCGGGGSGIAASGATVTVTLDGSATVLTEGVHWTRNSTRNLEAASIVAAIETISGMAAAVTTSGSSDSTLTAYASNSTWAMTLATSHDESANLAITNPSARASLVETAHGLAVDQNTLIMLMTNTAGVAKTHTSSDSETFAISTTASTTAITAQTAGDEDDSGQIINVPSVGTYIALWDEDSLTVDMWKSTNKGVAFSSSLADALLAPNGVHGAGLYYDLNGDTAPYVLVDDGLYAYDTSANVWHLLVGVPSTANTGKAHAVWANPYRGGGPSVYFGYSSGQLLEYTITSSGTTSIGVLDPNFYGALAADKDGEFWRLAGGNQWLFFTKGGGSASQKGWVGAYDGRAATQSADEKDYSEGFHFVNQVSTANRRLDCLVLSSLDDGKTRLHVNERTAATTSSPQFVLYPLSHPLGPDAIVYAAAGAQTRPRVDMGFPHDSGAVLAVALEADDLSGSTSGEYINLDRDMNNTGSFTDIGNILSGARVLELGSGAGVSFREAQIKENYVRDGGDTTQSPKGHDMEIIYSKQILKIAAENDGAQVLRRFTFDIDVQASAQGQENQTPADILTALYAAEASDILVPLAYGQVGTAADPLYVRFRMPGIRHDISTSSENYGDEASHVPPIRVYCETLS